MNTETLKEELKNYTVADGRIFNAKSDAEAVAHYGTDLVVIGAATFSEDAIQDHVDHVAGLTDQELEDLRQIQDDDGDPVRLVIKPGKRKGSPANQ